MVQQKKQGGNVARIEMEKGVNGTVIYRGEAELKKT